MQLTRFHEVRSAVQTKARPGGTDDLTAAATRVEDGLIATGWFDDVEVGATDEVDNLVVALCRYPGQLPADRVAQRLVRLWEDRLRYPFWGVHATLVDPDQVELEGATRIRKDGHYVTVHVVAQRGAPRSLDGALTSVFPDQRSLVRS